MAQHQERKIVHIKDVFGGKEEEEKDEEVEEDGEDIIITPQMWGGGINKPSASSFIMGNYRPKILGGSETGSKGSDIVSNRSSMSSNLDSNFHFGKTYMFPAPPAPPPPPAVKPPPVVTKTTENSAIHLLPLETNDDIDDGHTHVSDLESGSVVTNKSSDSGVDDFDIHGFMSSYSNKGTEAEEEEEPEYVNDIVLTSRESLPSGSSGVETDDYVTPSELNVERNSDSAVVPQTAVDDQTDSGQLEPSSGQLVELDSETSSIESGQPKLMEFMEDEAIMDLDSEEDEMTSELPRLVYREYQGEDFAQFLGDDNLEEEEEREAPVAKPRYKKKKRKPPMSPSDTQGSSSSKENDKKTLKKKINQVFNQAPVNYMDTDNYKQSIHNYSFANSKMASVFGDVEEPPKMNGDSDTFNASNTLSNKWWKQEMVTTHTATGNMDILLKPRLSNPNVIKDSAFHDMMDTHLPMKHDYEDFEQARKAAQFDCVTDKNKSSKNSLWRKLSNSFRKRDKPEDFLDNQAVNPLTAQFNMDL